MVNTFNSAASPLSEAEQALTAWAIKYEKRADGTLFVDGDLDIAGKALEQLPDLSAVHVGGSFLCRFNMLTSLEGAPQHVAGDFCCHGNLLTSLKGAPQSVGGSFRCQENRLTSLEYAPQSVGENFNCDNNSLTSLKGAPPAVSGDFVCSNNFLESLEHAPIGFGNLVSDFGRFSSWEAVPEELRMPEETRAQYWGQVAAAATVLQAPMRVRRPLVLKGMAHA